MWPTVYIASSPARKCSRGSSSALASMWPAGNQTSSLVGGVICAACEMSAIETPPHSTTRLSETGLSRRLPPTCHVSAGAYTLWKKRSTGESDASSPTTARLPAFSSCELSSPASLAGVARGSSSFLGVVVQKALLQQDWGGPSSASGQGQQAQTQQQPHSRAPRRCSSHTIMTAGHQKTMSRKFITMARAA